MAPARRCSHSFPVRGEDTEALSKENFSGPPKRLAVLSKDKNFEDILNQWPLLCSHTMSAFKKKIPVIIVHDSWGDG